MPTVLESSLWLTSLDGTAGSFTSWMMMSIAPAGIYRIQLNSYSGSIE
jgi:hypothetical protein